MGEVLQLSRPADELTDATELGRRGDWFDSLKGEALSFFKGDNNAPWAILAETVIGCIPVVGQLVDARDIIKGMSQVCAAPASSLAWFNLITATIGLAPGGGDAAKRSLRAVKSGTANVDDLLAMIRRFYNGDPEKLLRQVLDLSAVRKQLDNILANPTLTRHLSKDLKKQINDIRAALTKQFDTFKKEVDDWLSKGRKTTAEATQAKKAPGSPEAKSGTQAKEGSRAKGEHADDALTNTSNNATRRTQRLKNLSQKVLGILGEHMADYHCQDVKGWGTPARHDQGQTNPAKLNDRHQLVQLWPPIPRGRGIDAVWQSNGIKPYAIIEAKASYDPTKSLARLLGEAGDKMGRGGSNAGSGSNRGGGAGTRRGGASGTTAIRQTNGKVTQMSHGWIEKRLSQALKSAPNDLNVLRRRKRDAYTRHVLFFSIPHAVSHAEAQIMHTAGQPVDHRMHATHDLTREWRDTDIEKVVDNRAGFKGPARDQRTR